ncbi:MAG: hypothetical protein KBB09_03865, partial [Firmicutes bacterium]|nr:hypothetical protein [Bacillota bacterium]
AMKGEAAKRTTANATVLMSVSLKPLFIADTSGLIWDYFRFLRLCRNTSEGGINIHGHLPDKRLRIRGICLYAQMIAAYGASAV